MEHKYTNQLIHETSPYLIQHAHNPVSWYPWGPEALRLAREQNKPIFMSIGYAACHWCHVMEHESFEDEEVARIINKCFIPIKVDREERPDLDEIYMKATILYTHGHGGWPMSIWLTPEGKPFFAGTYFPPDNYYGRPSFKSVLIQLAQLWQEKEADLAADANKVAEALRDMDAPQRTAVLPREVLTALARRMVSAYDPRQGGVGSGSNKFPPSMSMELLLREYHSSRESFLIAPVELTLEKMAQGGIYDHLGGGIHRYSTDPDWLVPHFEKMLYDQALVSSIYLDGYQVTKRAEFAETAHGVFDYALRNLQSSEGGFYSTEDADSEGMEGKFYIWTLEQVQQVLGQDAPLFAAYYDITSKGNWQHPGDAHVPSGPKNIPRIQRPLEEVTHELGLNAAEAALRLAQSRRKLYDDRKQRIKPGLDDKILAAWNGLMISSLAKGSAVLDEPRYRDAAERAADFVLSRMQADGRLLRSYRQGRANLMGYLDDYAFLIDGLIGLYEATGSLRWLQEAERLLDISVTHYWDHEEGGFFFTASDHEHLILRSKLANDNAIPSGNSVMVTNLLRLQVLLGRSDLRDKAVQILSLFSGAAAESPFGHERFLCGVEAWHEGFQEIAIIGDLTSPEARKLVRAVHDVYLPNKVIALLDPASPDVAALRDRLPLLVGKNLINGEPAAFICRNYACQAPTSDPQVLRKALA